MTRAQRIFERWCTFVLPLYFGSKNAATRPIVTRVSRGSSFSRFMLSISLSLSWILFSFFVKYRDLLSFNFSERRLHAFALTASQFVRNPSLCLFLSLSIIFYLILSLFLSLNPHSFVAVHSFVSLL